MKRVLLFINIAILFSCNLYKVSAQSISLGQVYGHITVCQGAESQNQNIQFFTVQGANLTGNVTAVASVGFEISVSEYAGYGPSLTLTPVNKAISDTVYVRMTPSAVTGNVSGTITVSSPGASPQTAQVNGVVLALPSVKPVNNITVLNGATISGIHFGGTGNAYTWASSMPGIGTAASGVDSIPHFTAVNNGASPVTATIMVTPLLSGEAYVTNDSSGTVSVINTELNIVDTTISSGGLLPQGACLSPDGSTLYVANSGSNTVSVFNTATKQMEAVVPVGRQPVSIAVSPDNSRVFVSNAFENFVSVIDAATLKVTGTIPLPAPYGGPITATPYGTIYVVYSQGVAVYNAVTLQRVALVGTLTNLLFGEYIAANAAGNQVFLTYTRFEPGTITIINSQTNLIVSSFEPGEIPFGLAFSPDGRFLFTTKNSTLGLPYSVDVLNAANGFGVATATTPHVSNGVAITPDGTRLFASNYGSNTVTCWSVVNNNLQTLAVIPGGQGTLISTNSIKAGGCNGPPVTFTITVNPAPLPAVAVTGNLTPLATVYGTPSASESFSISAVSLRAAMLITAPKGFEVSLDNITFSPIVSAGYTGVAAPVTVYIRLAAATPVGNYSGNVTITGPALNYKLPIPESSVTPAPLTIIADNKTRVYGAPNPPLTITYKGFVNNDTPGDLFAYPVASTNAAVNSPPGNYPINVSGAGSVNYAITYVPGVLTIFSNVVIPNAFTPNGDGVNDTWDIQRIGDYPDCTVQVFNRYGSMVYSSVGYGVPWNGSYKGAPLPPGTYYYIINLNAGVPVLSGFVAIIR